MRNVRLHELFQSDCARLSHDILLGDCLLFFRILLGDPEHSFARCGLAKTEMRLARDGHAYTFREFEEEHGEWATWCWERSTLLNPVSKSKYRWFGEHEKQACHRALLRILRRQNDILIGRKVLTDPRTVQVLSEPVRQLIAGFIAIDQEAKKAMTYMERTLPLEHKSLAKGLISPSDIIHGPLPRASPKSLASCLPPHTNSMQHVAPARRWLLQVRNSGDGQLVCELEAYGDQRSVGHYFHGFPSMQCLANLGMFIGAVPVRLARDNFGQDLIFQDTIDYCFLVHLRSVKKRVRDYHRFTGGG